MAEMIVDLNALKPGGTQSAAGMDGKTFTVSPDQLQSIQAPKPQIDDTSGAPYWLRAVVGNQDDPATRLQMIQKQYPDARAQGDDNFVYTDPKTNKQTLYNPKGFDLGDVVSVGRPIVQLAAAAPTIPAGPIGAAIGGSALAAGAGQAYDSLLKGATNLFKPGMVPDKSQVDKLAGFAAETGLGTLLGVPMNYALKGAGSSLAPIKESVAQAWDRMGKQIPSVGAVSPGRGAWSSIENAVGAMLGGAGRINEAGRAGQQAFTDAIDETARLISREMPTTEGLGAKALQSVPRSLDNFRSVEGAKQEALDALIAPYPAKLDNSISWAKNANASLPQGGNVRTSADDQVASILAPLMEDSNKGLLNVSALKKTRGDLLPLANRAPEFRPGTPSQGQAKALRGELQNDIIDSLPTDLQSQYLGAQKSYKEGLDRFTSADNLLKARNGNPKSVGDMLSAPNANAKNIETITAVSPKLSDDIAARLIKNSGIGREGESMASPANFLTNWRKNISPETQYAAMKGVNPSARPQAGQMLGDTQLMAEGLQDAGKLYNTSQTATNLSTMNLLGRLAGGGAVGGTVSDNRETGAAFGAAAGVALPSILSRMVTSPGVISMMRSPTYKAIGNGLASILNTSAKGSGVIGGSMIDDQYLSDYLNKMAGAQ